MNIYRNEKTGRLVRVNVVTPRTVLGSWFETVDLFSGEVARLASFDDLELVSES